MITKEIQHKLLTLLMPHQPERVGIFGSYARREQTKNSDLDVLIHLKKNISLLSLVQLQQELSDALGIQVDLITENSVKNPRLKAFIYQDLITIFDAKKQPHLS